MLAFAHPYNPCLLLFHTLYFQKFGIFVDIADDFKIPESEITQPKSDEETALNKEITNKGIPSQSEPFYTKDDTSIAQQADNVLNRQYNEFLNPQVGKEVGGTPTTQLEGKTLGEVSNIDGVDPQVYKKSLFGNYQKSVVFYALEGMVFNNDLMRRIFDLTKNI